MRRRFWRSFARVEAGKHQGNWRKSGENGKNRGKMRQLFLRFTHKVREIIKLLYNDGWEWVGTRGSHRYFKHPEKPGKVTVAGHPSKDLRPKTKSTILKQAGFKK